MFPGVCIAIPHWRDNGKQFSMHRSVLMEPRSFNYMVEASRGERLSGLPESVVQRVCTDSRQLQRNDLFVPLSGERFDGHAFLGEAARRGATACLVERRKLPDPWPECGLIAVENTRRAFGDIAARYRQDFSIPVIAVAGSNGKTTTKELLAAVLRQRFKTLSSRASFNNDVGVPATLLELEPEHELAVLEFGTNHPGELAPLLKLARPQLGVLTSIGREHLEFFGDLNGVLEEEGWLAELLPATGRLFLNGDSMGVEELRRRSAAPLVRVGFSAENAWRAGNLRLGSHGVTFEVVAPTASFSREFRIGLLGRHQVRNALLAMAVAAELGMSPEEVQKGLSECRPAKLRLQPWAVGGVQVLDDSYNANADSMRAALETLRDFPGRGRRIAVLGDMAELGAHTESAHAEIGAYAAALGIQQLIAVGRMASVLAASARAGGLPSVFEFPEVDTAAAALRELVQPGDVVLLKGSRRAALERVGDQLREALAGKNRDVGQGPNPLGRG
jgi:UDP-N-acetylmuramoyl-tripeptide--D-alanyl-D-alanine ligase